MPRNAVATVTKPGALDRVSAMAETEPDEEPLVIGGVYIGTKAEREARAAAAIRLLDEWMAEDPAYDRETWPELRKALNENRRAVGARLLFPDEEP